MVCTLIKVDEGKSIREKAKPMSKGRAGPKKGSSGRDTGCSSRKGKQDDDTF
jgi:hypothetical protein